MIARARDGFRMLVVTKGDFMQQYLWWFGLWEPCITDVFKQYLRAGDVCVDLGANVGYYSLLASRLVGQRGCVHAFEPNPVASHLLGLNLDLNGVRNVELHRVAASDTTGSIELHQSDDGELGHVGVRWQGVPFRAPSVALDDAISITDQKRCRLIKIDVEGGELAALRGAMRILAANERIVVVCEVWQGMAPEVCSLMESIGFRAFQLLNDYSAWRHVYFRKPTEPPRPIVEPPSQQCDLLFLRREQEGFPAGASPV